MRPIKSAREIAVIREATRITGLGIMEAMRDAQPGMHEYELQADAEFVFKKCGAYGPSYFALIATGQNMYYSHYHRNTAMLEDGDLVQFDYAPDYKYYQSDVTRVFPANGRFTPRQREFYTIYLRLYQAVMTSIQVHAARAGIIKNAVVKMDAIIAVVSIHRCEDQGRGAGVRRALSPQRSQRASSLGHAVGMEVHDVGRPPATLEPGAIFTIEPAMQIADEHVGIRLEDMILITENGYENLSAFVPIEIDAIEKADARAGSAETLARRSNRSGRKGVHSSALSLLVVPHDVRPELGKQVAASAREKAGGAAEDRLSAGRGARWQPGVLDHVVEHVARVSAPCRRQMPVRALCEEHRLECIAGTRPETAACRWDVARVLAPDGTGPRFDRARDRDVRLPLDIALPEPLQVRCHSDG